MVLVTNKDLMIPARKNGYAIAALNVQNLESMSAVAEAAAEEKSSFDVILKEIACDNADYAKCYQICRLSLHIELGENCGATVTCADSYAS